jgi:hypothetical protein
MPQGIEDNRLKNRKRPLIQPEWFDSETFSLFQLRLSHLDMSCHIDDLLTEMCESTVILQGMMTAFVEPGARKWPKELKPRLRIPFTECRVVASKVYFRDRLVIDLDDTNIQLQLIHRTHTSGPGGHLGRVKTLDMMNRKYWWPGMSIAVRTYCNVYLLYDKTKTTRSLPVGFLKPLVVPLPPYKRKDQVFQHVVVRVDCLI